MNRCFVWALTLSCGVSSGRVVAGDRSKEVDFAKFKEVINAPAEKVKAQVGEPAARYTENGVEHWLYDNSTKVVDGMKLCPELLLKNGKSFQLNSVPKDKQEKAIKIVKGFGNWTPPREVKEKAFTIADSRVVGWSKAQIEKKFGQPDAKRVFDGREVWDYYKVPMSKDDKRQLTLFVEFEGDKVHGTAGN